MLNQNWRSISFIIFLFSSITILYLYTAEYSLNDISPENYLKLLRSKDENLGQVNSDLQNAIPDRIPLAGADNFTDSDNFRGNGLNVKNEKTSYGNVVRILSSNSGLGYQLIFDAGVLSRLFIYKSGMYIDFPSQFSESAISDIVNKLVLNNSYILKHTDYKNGYDLIIKETNESFIIGAVSVMFSNGVPYSINFYDISKKKYMKFLH